jgi:hypothetical protein
VRVDCNAGVNCSHRPEIANSNAVERTVNNASQ